MKKDNRRDFIRRAALSGAGLGLSGSLSAWAADAGTNPGATHPVGIDSGAAFFAGTNSSATHSAAGILSAGPVEFRPAFVPRRAASWWTTLEDILWPEKKVVDRIKRRAESFAKAKIDTAVNFGFHIRFDFSNYFGQLHGYFANVCDELHRNDIKFMEHYSCNHVERPKGDEGRRLLQKKHRHHVLLFHDPVAAQFAHYEGHSFNDCCEIDLRDGSRGYAEDYALEVFCHNNPGFLDMHRKYLQRLMREVPFDGIQIDDMCDYAGFTTCGCRYCRERLRKEYGREIPPFGEASFWGDTGLKDRSRWGNYENPAFRDWLRMKSDSVVDHLKMIRGTIGTTPLMTCCSNAGPIVLNSIALNLEKIAPYLDFFLLENVGINVETVNWMGMDAEAMYQKDMAGKWNNAPAITISYMVCEKGGYLGWSLARFWGVANWSSTLYGRLEEDPAEALEVEDIMSPYHHWEVSQSDLNGALGSDLVEVRLLASTDCRENGWRRADGKEQWDMVTAWSALLLKHNIGYRLLRSGELAGGGEHLAASVPLILDGVACVSDQQFRALDSFLAKGGAVWMAGPFGTHDEKGFQRKSPLSDELRLRQHKHLIIVPSATEGDCLQGLISEGRFHPVMRQLSGSPLWAARVRFYKDGPAIHFLNRGLVAVPDPVIRENSGLPVLKDFYAEAGDHRLEYAIDPRRLPLDQSAVKSPELGQGSRLAVVTKDAKGQTILQLNLDGVDTYAVVQSNMRAKETI